MVLPGDRPEGPVIGPNLTSYARPGAMAIN